MSNQVETKYAHNGHPYTTVCWSARYRGLMFGTASMRFCDSQDEYMYETEASAREALEFYRDRFGLAIIAPHGRFQ